MVDYTLRPAARATALRVGRDAHFVARRVHEAVDAEGDERQDEEEDDDYDCDYVVLLDHLGGRGGGTAGDRGSGGGFSGEVSRVGWSEVVVGSGRFRSR